jgi:hypothetical protein
MLCIAVFIMVIFFNESNASEAISETPTIVYYEHVPFIDIYEGQQDPMTAVSASNLILVNKLSSQINTKFLPR